MMINMHIIVCLMLLAIRLASASTFTITSIADSGPGTLRDALARAADGDTINATWIHGTIRLTSGELFVGKSVIIAGPGPARLAVDANRLSRLFHIGPGMVVSLAGIGIYNGGGIYNDHATLTVRNCIVIGNFGGGGAGLRNDGHLGTATLNVVNSLIMSNSCPNESSNGGGILNDGSDGNANVTLVNSIVRDNSTGFLGGGIFNDGTDGNATVTMISSIVNGNNAGGFGGGIYNAGWFGTGLVTMENSIVNENQAGKGGGVFNAGYGGSASLNITNCSIIGNKCFSYGGGLCNSMSGGNALMNLVNSTISKNSAAFAGGVFSGHDYFVPIVGPGNASLQILNCTFSDNLAEAIYLANGAGTGTVEIGSTIINASALGSTISSNSVATSLGYNLSSDDGGGVLTNSTDLINTDPQLGPLRDNGGLTLTHALLPGSPALDQGKNFSGLPFDQRGHSFTRTFDNRCIPNSPDGDGTDIGAFEVHTASPVQGVQYLLTLVNSQVDRPQPLRAILDRVLISIGWNNTATISQLTAFQQQVSTQVLPSNQPLAAVLLQAAQDIISTLDIRR